MRIEWGNAPPYATRATTRCLSQKTPIDNVAFMYCASMAFESRCTKHGVRDVHAAGHPSRLGPRQRMSGRIDDFREVAKHQARLARDAQHVEGANLRIAVFRIGPEILWVE